MRLSSTQVDINLAVRVFFLVAVACSVAALYLAIADSGPSSPVSNPDLYYGSLPHAFPSAN